MTSSSKDNKDDSCWVSLPQSEWLRLDRWLGNNVSAASLVLTEMNRIRKTAGNGSGKAIHIGIPTIDGMIGGLLAGEVLYIGNTEEQCNSAFGLNIVKSAGIEGGKNLLVFNAGRGQYAYARQLISLCAEIDDFTLKNGQSLSEEDQAHLDETAEKIQAAQISVISTPNICVEDICAEVQKLKEPNIPEIILADNLRFLTTRKLCENRTQEYHHISQALWSLARDTGIPIVVSGPLSRRRQKMERFWPTAYDMPADGMLDSFDKIVMAHRCKMEPEILYVTSVKNPYGTYGCRRIEYDPAFGKLTEVIMQEEQDQGSKG